MWKFLKRVLSEIARFVIEQLIVKIVLAVA